MTASTQPAAKAAAPSARGLTFNATRRLIPYLFVAPAMIAITVLVFFPLFNGIYLSFTDANQYNTVRRIGENVTPATYTFIGLDNYNQVLNNDVYEFWKTFRQTIIWTSVNITLHITIGLALAMLLNRPIRGRAVYRMLLIVPWAIPSYISGFSWRFLFNEQLGFFNRALTTFGLEPIQWLSDPTWATLSVITANTWIAIPFNMVAFLGGLQSIPPDLYEAAEVDGCTGWQKFAFITFPLLRPVMFVTTLVGIIWTFNSFNIIFLVTEGGPFRSTEILATWAWRLGFTRSWEFGIAAAYSVIILLILMAFTLIYVRSINSSSEGRGL